MNTETGRTIPNINKKGPRIEKKKGMKTEEEESIQTEKRIELKKKR